MATRKGPAPKPASLKPEQAIPLLEQQIAKADPLRPTHGYSPERQEWIHTSEGALAAALGSDDVTIHKFSGAQCGSYGMDDTDEELRQNKNEQLDAMLAVLRSAVQQLRWQLPDPKQVFLPAGSQHDAFLEIRKIIQQAQSEVLIVDTWVDQTLWPLLTNVPRACNIRIMGEHFKGDFQLEGKKFVAQHGASVEVRMTPNYHDRFIFLDKGRCFHLGASIKDAGNKAFAFSEFDRPQLVAVTLADAENEWSNAMRVAL